MSTWHTMRSRSPNGASTVYKVHDNVMYGNGGGGQPQHHHHHQGGGGMQPMYTTTMEGYGGGGEVVYVDPPPPTMQPYSPYAESPVIYVRGNDDTASDDDSTSASDDEESQSSSASDTSSSSAYPNRNKNPCTRTTPACLFSGIFVALGFLTCYVFLIGALVNHSREGKPFTIYEDAIIAPTALRSGAASVNVGGTGDVVMAGEVAGDSGVGSSEATSGNVVTGEATSGEATSGNNMYSLQYSSPEVVVLKPMGPMGSILQFAKDQQQQQQQQKQSKEPSPQQQPRNLPQTASATVVQHHYPHGKIDGPVRN